ncbi:TnsA-like heteromeric transposase endonuclease subunit [Streptomyces sp. NPDC050433]|uniref:TnsA-like heteromeric transposase endonuclease subunit n=1 Tax=unclassified Streptomyces TaxID=2593676 RepID=UPI00342CE4F2
MIYESRLELSRLLFADFDRSVRGIVAQPFLLKAVLEGKVRRHIPDYLLITEQVPMVVDVKPLHRLSMPEVAFTFAWTRRVVESRGWKYEVWSEPPAVELENIRFLAGYRRDWLFDDRLLDQVRSVEVNGQALAEVVEILSSQEPAAVRSSVLHLLWRGELATDLTAPLGDRHRLRRPA